MKYDNYTHFYPISKSRVHPMKNGCVKHELEASTPQSPIQLQTFKMQVCIAYSPTLDCRCMTKISKFCGFWSTTLKWTHLDWIGTVKCIFYHYANKNSTRMRLYTCGWKRSFTLACRNWTKGLTVTDLCQDFDGKDHYLGSGVVRHHWQCQGQDSRQGRNPSRPTTFDFRWKAIGRRSYFGWLQHSKGEHFALGFEIAWRCHWTHIKGFGFQVQLWKDDLPQVLCSSPTSYVETMFDWRFLGASNCRKKKCGHTNQIRPKKKLK